MECLILQLSHLTQDHSHPGERKYVAVDQRLKLLKEAYIGGEKTIDRYIVGVAYN